MWRSMLGTEEPTSPGDAEDPTDDDNDKNDNSPDTPASNGSMFGQFAYLGSVASKFAAAVGQDEELSEEEDEGWGDPEEDEGEGWNDEDDDLQFDDTSTGRGEEPVSVAKSLSEVNEADHSVAFTLSEVNDDSIAITRSAEPSEPTMAEEEPAVDPSAANLSLGVNGDDADLKRTKQEQNGDTITNSASDEAPALAAESSMPSTPDDNDQVLSGGTVTPADVDAGIVSSHRDVAGRLDAVIQQIDAMEQENINTSTLRNEDENQSLQRDLSLSDEEHQHMAEEEIRSEMERLDSPMGKGLLVDHTPALTTTGNDDDTARAADEPSRLEENDDDEQEYGPVVDLLPQKPVAMARHDSMAVQILMEENDEDDDDAGSGWQDDEESELAMEGTAVPVQPTEPTVVDHTPLVLEHDDTALSIRVVASVVEEEEAAPDAYGPVVDLTPPTPAHPNILAESMAVNAAEIEKDFEDDDEMDFTSNEDDSAVENGWDEDDDYADAATVTTEGKRTTFAPEVFSVDNPALVDHLPSEMLEEDRAPYDHSVIALATTEDMTRDTNMDEEDDENEDAYGPVVDQTPETPAFSGVNSCAAHAASEADSIRDDETEEAGVRGWANDDEDEAKNDDLALVDHTPSEIESPTKRADVGSVEVVPSRGTVEASITCDENEEAIVYGPVVDHTPNTPAAGTWTRSESIVAQANDDLGTVDETTVREPADDDDTLRDEENTEDGDQVVDYIPTGQESRYGDGSTLAAADPSEILSVVDGLAPEDQNFGPVVDVTPQPLVGQVPLGEGSTAVFASPSVVVDDLDPPEEDGGIEPEGWEDEAAPNPQCGIEEPVAEENEQLVDFLPPTNIENPGADTTREGFSDFTVGGAQSFLMQGENPREDDFGPVVDQLPSSGTVSSHFSIASMATQLTPSECRAMEKDDIVNGNPDESLTPRSDIVVDHLPSIGNKNPMDSAATNLRSLLSEEEEEGEEDATKFGPVVDHLPTSRASVAPSRGGSTVDALATVSEAHSYEEGSAPGWPDEDEVEFDASIGDLSDVTEQAASRPKSNVNHSAESDRNVSVRFDSSVNGSKVASESEHIGQITRAKSTDEVDDDTEFHDPAVAWDLSGNFHDAHESLVDKSFSEADTPPSTPHRRPSKSRVLDPQEVMALPQLGTNLDKGAADFDTTGLVTLPGENSGLVIGDMVTPDGDVVKVDLSKVLQDEIARRRLLEEELKAMKSTSKPTYHAMHEEKSLAAAENEATEALRQNEALLKDNEKLKVFLAESKKSIAMLQELNSEKEAKEVSFVAEAERLKEALAAAGKSGSSEASNLAKLQLELAAKDGECKSLATRISALEKRLFDAQQANANQAHESADLSTLLKENIASLKHQLVDSDKLIEDTEQARRTLERKLESLEAEVANLRQSSKQVAKLQVQHEKDLQEQYKLLDRKTIDLRTLEEMVAKLQADKANLVADLNRQRKLAEHSAGIANELLTVAKERDGLENSLAETKATMNELQKLLDDQCAEREAFEDQRAKEHSALRTELEEVRQELSAKQSEFSAMTEQVVALQEERLALRSDVEEAGILKNSLENEIREVNDIVALERQKLEVAKNQLSKLEASEQENATEILKLTGLVTAAESSSTAKTDKIRELEEQIVMLEEKSSSMKSERDALMVSRNKAQETIEEIDEKYQDALRDFETKETELRANFQRDLDQLNEGSQRLEAEVRRLEESESLNARALEEVERSAAEDAQRFEESNAELTTECNELRAELERLEKLEAQHSLSLEELDKKTKIEIETLKEDLVRSQASDSIGTQPLDEVKRLREELEGEHSETVKKLEFLNENLRDEIAKNKEMHEATSELLESITSDKAALEEELRERKAEVDRLESLSAQLQSDQQVYESAKEEHRRSLEILQDTMTDRVQLYEQTIAELKSKQQLLQADVEKHSAAAESLQLTETRLAEALEQNDMMKTENEEMLVQFGLLKHEMDESNTYVKSLQSQIEEAKAFGGRSEETLKSDLVELREAHEVMASTLTTTEGKLKQTIEEKSKLSGELENLQSHATNLELRTAEQCAEIEALKLSATESSKRERSLGETADVLEEKDRLLAESRVEVAEAQQSVTSQRILVDELQTKLKEQEDVHEKSLEETTSRLAELEKQLDNAREENRCAEASLAARNQFMSMLKQSEVQIQDLEGQLKSKNASISDLQNNMEKLEAKLGSQSGNLEELESIQSQVTVLNEALSSTRNRLATKESEMDRLSAEIRELQASRSKDVIQTVTRELSTSTITTNDEDIIARAVQLRRSESDRAGALQRLDEERRANQEALQRLRASVTRYCKSPSKTANIVEM